jgi:hypothetical protein
MVALQHRAQGQLLTMSFKRMKHLEAMSVACLCKTGHLGPLSCIFERCSETELKQETSRNVLFRQSKLYQAVKTTAESE